MPDRRADGGARWPKGYHITLRCYGTWLHGDQRESVDRSHNRPGEPRLSPAPGRESSASARMQHPAAELTPAMRELIPQIVEQTAECRDWTVLACNARTNHVHIVICGLCRPEEIMLALQVWITRRLREVGLIGLEERLWSRHGSTRYLWQESDLMGAVTYVLECQDHRDE